MPIMTMACESLKFLIVHIDHSYKLLNAAGCSHISVGDWYSQCQYKQGFYKRHLTDLKHRYWSYSHRRIKEWEGNLQRKREKSDKNDKYCGSLANWMGAHRGTWECLACMILLFQKISSISVEWPCENQIFNQVMKITGTLHFPVFLFFFYTEKPIFTNQILCRVRLSYEIYIIHP